MTNVPRSGNRRRDRKEVRPHRVVAVSRAAGWDVIGPWGGEIRAGRPDQVPDGTRSNAARRPRVDGLMAPGVEVGQAMVRLRPGQRSAGAANCHGGTTISPAASTWGRRRRGAAHGVRAIPPLRACRTRH